MDPIRKKSKIVEEYGFTSMGQRHLQIVLLFVVGMIAYGMRAVISVGIVAMMSDNPPDESIPTYPEWTDKGYILSSFFWGYVIFQIVAGQIAEKYGPKLFLTTTFFIASTFTCLTPIMAQLLGSKGVIVNRVIQGLCQGFLYPSTHCILSKWTPLNERSRIAGFVYVAGHLGTAVSMVATGAISGTKLGWPYVFYLYGGLGIVWVICYAWLGSNSPAQHKSISFEERKYIEQTTEIRNGPAVPLKTPWFSIIKSLPFWAVIISHVGNNWGFWTLLTEIPSFMKYVLDYNIQDNSNLSALPYFVFAIFGIFLGPLSDYIITRNILPIGNSRKLFNSLGFCLPALFLIILSFTPKDNNTVVVILLVLAVSTNSGMLVGFNLNHIDVSPNFAGTLMGITNTFANIASIIAPLLVDFIVTDETNVSQWNIIFFVAAGMYIFATIFFLTFGSGEIQSWNFPNNDNKNANYVSSRPDHQQGTLSA